jgi:hypothetical protein
MKLGFVLGVVVAAAAGVLLGGQPATATVGGWSTPAKIFESVDGRQVALAATQDGIIHAVWSDNTFSGSQHEIVYSQKAAGGVWTTPVTVSDSTEEAECPEIAPGPSNSVHVAWLERGSGGSGTLRYRTRDADGSWSPDAPDIVGTGVLSNSGRPSMTVEGDGTVHIVWDDGNIQYRRRTPGGSWLSVETIRTASLGNWAPAIIATPDRTLHVVWAEGYLGPFLMYSSEGQGGVWTTPLSIAPTLSSLDYPDILAGSDGRVHVAVRAGSSNAQVYYVVRGADGVWSAPQNVSNDQPSFSPSMAWLGGGCIALVWNHLYSPYEVWYSELCPSQPWSTPYRMVGPSLSRNSPQIASVPGVVDVVAWYEGSSGSQDVAYAERYPAVGGIAELPDVAPKPAAASRSSRGDRGVFVALLATATAGAMTVAAGVWHARRRWLR